MTEEDKKQWMEHDRELAEHESLDAEHWAATRQRPNGSAGNRGNRGQESDGMQAASSTELIRKFETRDEWIDYNMQIPAVPLQNQPNVVELGFSG